jgi:amino acid permease
MFAKICYGRAGSIFIKVIIIVNAFGLCCAYFRIFGETAHTLIGVFTDDKDSYFLTNYNNYFYVLIIFSIMLFLIFKENIDSLKGASILGVIAISIFFVCLLIIFFYKVAKGEIAKFESEMLWPNGDSMEIISYLPTVFLAFTFQFNIFPIYFTLKNRSNKEMMKATTCGVIFCFVIYIITGIVGFLMYGYTLKDTILAALAQNAESAKGSDSFIIVVLVIVNIAFLISATMSIPLMFFSLKKNFLNTVIFCKKIIKKQPPVSVGDEELNTQNERLVVSTDTESKGREQIHAPQNQKTSLLTTTVKNVITICLYVSICIVTIFIPSLKTVNIFN